MFVNITEKDCMCPIIFIIELKTQENDINEGEVGEKFTSLV